MGRPIPSVLGCHLMVEKLHEFQDYCTFVDPAVLWDQALKLTCTFTYVKMVNHGSLWPIDCAHARVKKTELQTFADFLASCLWNLYCMLWCHLLKLQHQQWHECRRLATWSRPLHAAHDLHFHFFFNAASKCTSVLFEALWWDADVYLCTLALCLITLYRFLYIFLKEWSAVFFLLAAMVVTWHPDHKKQSNHNARPQNK